MTKTEEKKPVQMAFSGLRVQGSDLYSGVLDSSQNNIASSMASYNSPSAPAKTFAGGSGGRTGGGISGGQIAGAAGAAVNGVTEIAGHIKAAEVNRDWLIAQDDDRVAYGAAPKVGRTVGKSALSGAAAGAAVGSVFPGIGTVIGGAVGAVVGAAAGWIGGKRKERKYKRDMLARQKAVNDRRNTLSREWFLTETYEDGGVIDIEHEEVPWSADSHAVVLGGSLHSQGGNPIVDAVTGEKLYETEKGEILFTESQTKSIEDRINAFHQSGDERHLLFLGQIVKEIILTSTKDNSGKYRI